MEIWAKFVDLDSSSQIALASAVITVFGLILANALAIINMHKVRNKKISGVVHDLIEGLKKHQVGINISGLHEEKNRVRVEHTIRTILEKHFKL